MAEQNPWKRRGESLRRGSTALVIPSLFLGGPLGVGAIGYFVGGYFEHPTTGAFIGGMLGFAAAIRETIRIVRKLSRESESDK